MIKYLFSAITTLILSFFFIAFSAFAQKESVVYIGTNGKLTTLDQAIFMQKTLKKSSKVTTVLTYQLTDAKWAKLYTEKYKTLNDSTFQINGNRENYKGTTFRTFTKQADGSFKFRDVAKDQLLRSGSAKSVVPLLVHGQVTEYYPGGNKKSVSEYNENELVSNENWRENGDKYIDTIFYSVDSDPTFNPGIKVMHQHILKGFKEAGIDISSISGSLILGFVVMENGAIDGIKIIKGLASNINSIAFESFTTLQGSWTPAKLNGKTVRYFQIFPINFIYKQQSFEFAELGKGGILHWGAY
ncbi:MAG: hypothetical protein Q8R96_12700 [Bacteroidota bacterium]|nr:hypothetical protein [Bacteroidota bacterium]